jgi:superfamily II DNA or RNA helicase
MSAVPSGGGAFNPFDPLDRLVQADLLEELQQDKAAAEWRTPLLMRPYQQEADAAVIEAFREYRSVLVEMATGLGKTIILSHIAKAWPGRVLIIAHRDELIRQAVSKLRTVLGEEPGIEMGSERLTDSLERLPRVIVSSVQTMCRPGRHMRFPSRLLRLVNHRRGPPCSGQVLWRRHGSLPRGQGPRSDGDCQAGRPGGDGAGIRDRGLHLRHRGCHCNDGWLVPIHQQCVEVEGLDFSQVRDVAGDFNEGELSAILTQETPLHRMASPIVELAGSRSTLVFCCSVAHAQLLAEVIDRYRFRSAAWLSGETPIEQRRETIERFKRGELQFLLNCQLFLEGFDCPNTSLVVMGRPTKSLGLYTQVLGRGTRPLPGTVDGIETAAARRLSIAQSAKPNMVVLDFAGNAGRHKIITATDILGGKFTAPARQYAREAAEESDTPRPVQELLEEGELVSAYRLERDERLRRIRAQAQYQVNIVSPFDRGSTSAPHHGEESSRGEPATARQIWRLGTLGVSRDRASTYTKRQASVVIGKLLEERGES